MLKFSLDVKASNAAIHNGTLPKIMEDLMAKTKPEAAYFTAYGGSRTVFIFFDLKDPSDIPYIAEPLFSNFDATVEFQPVMNAEELQKGLAKAMGG